jgi:hypothetical protein
MNRLTARSKNGEAYYPVCIEVCDGEPQDCGNCDIDKDICDRLAAYEDTGLEPEEIPHWISVSERLPEELGHYLAVVKRIAPDEFGGNGTHIRIMRWLGDDWQYVHHIPEWINQKITETVTYWMYLPKLPEEPAITHNEESHSCENCGNIQCANSPIAYHWDECVDTNFTKHWIPRTQPPKE